MNIILFDDFYFDVGWKYDFTINMFGKVFDVILKAKSYRETDEIKPAQKEAIRYFAENLEEIISISEKALEDKFGQESKTRFAPTMVLFKKTGGFAILLDDEEDPDDGMAVVFKDGDVTVLYQDEYL